MGEAQTDAAPRWTVACPAHADGVCQGSEDGGGCETFVCPVCQQRRPVCYGAADDASCDACLGEVRERLDRLVKGRGPG